MPNKTHTSTRIARTLAHAAEHGLNKAAIKFDVHRDTVERWQGIYLSDIVMTEGSRNEPTASHKKSVTPEKIQEVRAMYWEIRHSPTYGFESKILDLVLRHKEAMVRGLDSMDMTDVNTFSSVKDSFVEILALLNDKAVIGKMPDKSNVGADKPSRRAPAKKRAARKR